MKMNQRFERIPRVQRSRIVPEMTTVARRASVELKTALERLTPVRKGKMRRSWHRRVTNTTRKVTATFHNAADYAGHVHYRGQPSKKVIDAAEALFEEWSAQLVEDMNERLLATITKES